MMLVVLLLVALSALFWGLVAARVWGLSRRLKTLDAATPLAAAGQTPLLSIIVPARNEARDIGPCLRSLAAQDYPHVELIVVDDESTDGTYEIATAALVGHPRARVVRGGKRPNEGWVGKSWAVQQGVALASGEWLLFVDADIVHHPATVRQAWNLCADSQLDAVSILPRIECVSFWERLSMPLFALLSVLVQAPDENNSSARSAARLSGAFILVRRAAYVACGGHRAVRSEIIEDLALARRLKQTGHRTHLTYTSDLTMTRMYASLGELCQGLSRLTFPTLGFSPVKLALACGTSFLATLVPLLPLVILGFAAPSTLLLALTAAGLSLWVLQAWITRLAYRLVGVSPVYGLLLPLAANLLCALALYSAWRHYTGRGIVWKSRTCAMPESARAPAAATESAPEAYAATPAPAADARDAW